MPGIQINNKKSFESYLKQFKRLCDKAGIIKELKDKQYYIKPTEKRKIAKRQAIKKSQKELRLSIISSYLK